MSVEFTRGLGTAPLASSATGPLWWGPQDRDDSIATVAAAAASGASFIDTAPFYGWGLAEEIVGEAIAGLAARPPILTKCGTVRRPDGSAADDASPEAIRSGVEASLTRLGLDRVDVVQIHDPDPAVPIEESWECLMELRAEGLIGGAGLSNHPVALMQRAQAVGPVAVVQQQYSLLHRRVEEDGVLDWCDTNGVPFLAWAPLASGFLVDGFELDQLAEGDLRRGLRWATDGADVTRRVRASLRSIAEHHGATMVSTAVAWVTSHVGVGAIVGARTPDEAGVFAEPELVLSATDLAELAASRARS